MQISHCPLLSLPLPSQEKKAVDRAKRLRKSQELVGLAQFLGKHQAPRVPGSHFHSLKFHQSEADVSASSTASPGLPEASWGQQRSWAPGSKTSAGGPDSLCWVFPTDPRTRGAGGRALARGRGMKVAVCAFPLDLGNSHRSSTSKQLIRGRCSHTAGAPRRKGGTWTQGQQQLPLHQETPHRSPALWGFGIPRGTGSNENFWRHSWAFSWRF